MIGELDANLLEGLQVKRFSGLNFPAAVYRMALTTKLPKLDLATRDSVRKGEHSLEDYSASLRRTQFQRDCEDCLLMAVDPRPSDED